MATIPTIQLFRNSIIKTGRQAAIDALETQKAFVADGGLILATYSGDNGVKTLLGIVRNSGSGNADLTIIDVEGAAENVQTAITSAINKLNKGDAEVEGEYVSSVSEENGIITVTRKSLPSFDEKTDIGKAITAITQTNGEVSVKFGGVAAANVSVADEGNKITATNVEDALLEIKTSLDNAIGTGGTVEKQISDAINALNSEKSGTSTSNHITVGVGQVAGKITSVTVSDSDIASAELLGTTSDAKDKATAFGRIAKEAADREAAIGALSTSSTVTLESAAGTESGVLKVYTIKQGDREVGKIDIPKDLVVKSGSVVKGNWNDGVFTENVSGSGTALKLVIANKEETPIYINTLDLVKDHTGGNGISISDTNVISVQIAEGSENFLTVGANGVKLSGVQAAIDAAAASATTKVEKTGEGSHITVTPTTAGNKSVTYTISESDIASANALTAETTARESADTALSDRLGDGVTSDLTATAQFAELNNKLGTGVSTAATETVTAQLQALSGSSTSDTSDTISVIGAKKYTDAKVEALNLNSVGGTGKVITAISQENGLVSASAIDLTASNVKATESTGVSTAVDVTGETVSEQIASLATSIKSVSTAAAAAHTVVNAKADGHVKVTVSSENSHAVVTITEDDIASASALGTETNARVAQDDKIEESIGLDAGGNHVKTNGHYTKDATTVVGEIEALDTKLKEVSDTLGTGVTTAATVTEQLQALSGSSIDGKDVTSVNGAKAYAKDLVDNLKAEVGSTTGTSKTEAIKIVQAHGKIDSITLGAFDCGTYN